MTVLFFLLVSKTLAAVSRKPSILNVIINSCFSILIVGMFLFLACISTYINKLRLGVI